MQAELSKYGDTTMAAIFAVDNERPSRLSNEMLVEINRKLQMVLEDALLKNITLKASFHLIIQPQHFHCSKVSRQWARRLRVCRAKTEPFRAVCTRDNDSFVIESVQVSLSQLLHAASKGTRKLASG